MLIGKMGRGHEQDVAAWSTARQTAGFWEDFVWALAYAVAVLADHQGRIGNGLGFDHKQSRLDGRCWGRRFRWSCSLSFTLATASGLFPAAFLASVGGSISLTGMPRPPVLGGFSTSGTAITSLWPRRHEPAFAIFKQAPATARVPTAKIARLTQRQRAGKLNMAHGRVRSRAVRRREGGTSRRYLAPKKWTPLVQASAADTCQLTCGNSPVREDAGTCREEGQYRDRLIAEWLNWRCDNGSVRGRR
jgi:hypothetical protein